MPQIILLRYRQRSSIYALQEIKSSKLAAQIGKSLVLTLNHPALLCKMRSIAVNVSPQNDPPSMASLSLETDEDTPVNIDYDDNSFWDNAPLKVIREVTLNKKPKKP